jgi:KRAB domain-containing zinc finger protein
MTCPKRFKQQSTLHAHWKVCKNEEKYSCPTCSKNMSSQHNLTTHKKTHDDVEKEFECPDPDCTKRFAQNAALKRHEVVHSGERKFECEVCEKKFTYQFNLTEHMLTHMDKQKKFKCKEDKKECKRFFRRKQHLTRHISRTHTEVQCENCMEKMAGLHNLKLHNIRTHTPVQCGICKEECAGRDNLELHNKTHEKEKRLECPRCDKKFGKKHHLSRHIFNLHETKKATLGHTKGERFECRRCDKKFVRKHLLTKHIITHTEVECEKCTPLKKVCVHVVFGGYTGAA